MASRKADKEAARQRRLEQEQAAQAASQRNQRLLVAGGLLMAVIAVAVVLVIVLGGSSSSNSSAKTNAAAATHPHSKSANKHAATVDTLLKGIPQNGTTLGNPKAPVTFTEYGDLECPICAEFATSGAESQLIKNYVRTGKVKLVYKSFETASSEQPNASTLWPAQQAAAYAAGAQKKAWNYIELFYAEQGQEGTPYVTSEYMGGLAKQIDGLDVPKWNSERFNPAYANQVVQEGKEATGLGINATPTLIATGQKSQTKPVSGAIPYGEVQSMIKSVS
jgi:protein-disulfide isomerase